MTAAILCNGEFPRKEYPLYLLESADILVCCDGNKSISKVIDMGLEPTLIVGDMDSTPARLQERYADRIVKVEEQDDNDLAKSFSVLRERFPEVDTIHILGGGGGNESHILGNLSWLMEWERRYSLAENGINVDMVSDYTTAFAISKSTELHLGEGRKVSFFTIDPSLRIKSTGLAWPLDEVVLDNWWKTTLNRATADIVSLELSHCSPVLIILD